MRGGKNKAMEEKDGYLKKRGLPPGALVHVGEVRSSVTHLTVIDYSKTAFAEQSGGKELIASLKLKKGRGVLWLNVDGLHDIPSISSLGSLFGLHGLLLEDVLNTAHRPKIEEYDKHLFMTLKMVGLSEDGTSVVTEQVSLVLGSNWLISFQEKKGDLFDSIRKRLRENTGPLRSNGADFLFYRIADVIVDNYFWVVDSFASRVEELEEKILNDFDKEYIKEIQRLKKDINSLKRVVMPLRESLFILSQDMGAFFNKNIYHYFHDILEHLMHINETIESQRESVASLMDLYLSEQSNKMNQVMQVLTVIATIFIPLTFIAGIYGMNFRNMPELEWSFGYPLVWAVMISLVVFMVYFFKRKKLL